MRGRDILAPATVVSLTILLEMQASPKARGREARGEHQADIVVTAHYRAQNLPQAPLAISAAHAELPEAPSIPIPSFAIFARLKYWTENRCREARFEAANLFAKHYPLNHFDQQATLLAHSAARVAPPRRSAVPFKHNFGHR